MKNARTMMHRMYNIYNNQLYNLYNKRMKGNKHMENSKILAVDDNHEILDILKILLSNEGYEVVQAENGKAALELIDDSFDLVILDVMMPDISGFKVCEEIRKSSNVPVLFLTAKSLDEDKSLGLLIGGDDYLVKPFSHAELNARVKSLLRRYHVYKGKDTGQHSDFYEYGGFRVNKELNEAYADEKELDLTELEYQILKLLISAPKRIFPTQLIFETVWGEPYMYSSSATVMVHIRKLRMKAEDDPQNPRHIMTVWGKGYRFE